jgi:hypothetical protein
MGDASEHSYGGQPVAGSWKIYSIPLTALGGVNKTVGGIFIQDESGKAEPPLYVGAIQLTASTPQRTHFTLTPTSTSTPVVTPTATVGTTPIATSTKPHPMFWGGIARTLGVEPPEPFV